MPYKNYADKLTYNKIRYKKKKAGAKSGTSLVRAAILPARKKLTEQEKIAHRKASHAKYYQKQKLLKKAG